MWERLLHQIAKLAETRGRTVIVGIVLLAFAMAAAIPGLRISSSYRDLMPADRPEQREYDAFLEEFGAANDLIVVLEGDPAVTRPAADELARRLVEAGDPIADVFYKFDIEEMARRAPLYFDLPRLEETLTGLSEQRFLLEKIGLAQSFPDLLEEAGSLMAGEDESVDLDPAGAGRAVDVLNWLLGEWEARLDDPGRSGFDLPELHGPELEELRDTWESRGFLGSRDNGMLFLFVKPHQISDDPKYLETVEAAVLEKWDSLSLDTGSIEIAFTGLPAHILTDVRSLREDLIRASVPSGILVFLVLWIGLRSIRRTAAALFALGCGLAISLGLARFVFVELNRMSMSFLAIMFGIGIDFAIYLIRRTDEEINQGLGRREAVGRALAKSGKGIITGGIVTALAFSVTAVSEFRGTSQLGLTTAVSVVVVLVVTLLLLPPVLMRTKAPEQKREPATPDRSKTNPSILPFSRRATGIGLLLILTLAGIGIFVAQKVPVDYNGLSVMPVKAQSTEYQMRMQEESDFQMTSAIVRAKGKDELETLVAKVRELPSVSRVVTLGDLIPEGQEEKISLVRRSREALGVSLPSFSKESVKDDYLNSLSSFEESLLEAQDLAFSAGQSELTEGLQKTLDLVGHISGSFAESADTSLAATREFESELDAAFRKMEGTIRSWRELRPVSTEDLPSGFVDRFRSDEGNYAAYVYPSGSVWEMEFLDTFLGDLRELSSGNDGLPGAGLPGAGLPVTGFPVVSQSNVGLLTSGIFQSLFLTVVVVVVLLSLDLRKWDQVIYALFPLLVGMSILQAWLFATGQGYNLASINGLPLLLGLGVVYGVHIVHRWSENPGRSAFHAVKTSGRAITLAGITTMAGLASLTFCIHRGVASFGWLLLQGIICMLVSALVALPLLIDWVSFRKKTHS